MAFFRVLTHIGAPVSRVWSLLEDWEGSAEWMVDATTVHVVGARRSGAGTVVRAVTRIAGVPLTDVMRVIEWQEERLMVVEHIGWPIRGIAWFELRPDGTATWFEWAEELDPPLGPLGELAGRLLRRPIEAVLRRSALRLKHLAETAPR